MAILEGYVAHIRFRNEENGYTVLTLETSIDEETCVGNFNYINEGEYMRLEGDYMEHPVHGPQFKVEKYEVKAAEGIK
ncbi:MAG: ATP-dependent RecD-like DNA helicase, partial [Firmicutes bacterium]|nr:ATP-dependent RecD-like DNA helicase [Candidatus Scybalomonas excrementavium]